MAVGPSAPPMIPIEPATARSKLIPGMKESKRAPRRAVKIPNWAAAPKRRVLGLAMSGPKSVIDPTPMKMRIGKSPVSIPAS